MFKKDVISGAHYLPPSTNESRFAREKSVLLPRRRQHDNLVQIAQRTPKPQAATTQSDLDLLKQNYMFVRDDSDDEEEEEGDSLASKHAGERLAAAYYRRLFKEYVLCDLSRHRKGQVGMRWRTELEVVSGKGQYTCGSLECNEDALESYELLFNYTEQNHNKQALVKARLSPAEKEVAEDGMKNFLEMDFTQKRELLESHVTEAEEIIQELDEVENVVELFPNKVERPAMIPLMGSNEILCEGRFDHTGAFYVQIGENYLTRKTSKEALTHISNRRNIARSILVSSMKELEQLDARIQMATQCGLLHPPSASREAAHPPASGEASAGGTPEEDGGSGPGVIRKSPDGFLEIIEEISDTVEHRTPTETTNRPKSIFGLEMASSCNRR